MVIGTVFVFFSTKWDCFFSILSFYRLPLPSKSADWTHFGGKTLRPAHSRTRIKEAIIETADGALLRHD